MVVEFEPIKGYITQMPLQLRCDHQTKFRITAGNEPKLYFLLPKSELEQRQLFPFKLSSPPPPCRLSNDNRSRRHLGNIGIAAMLSEEAQEGSTSSHLFHFHVVKLRFQKKEYVPPTLSPGIWRLSQCLLEPFLLPLLPAKFLCIHLPYVFSPMQP